MQGLEYEKKWVFCTLRGLTHGLLFRGVCVGVRQHQSQPLGTITNLSSCVGRVGPRQQTVECDRDLL